MALNVSCLSRRQPESCLPGHLSCHVSKCSYHYVFYCLFLFFFSPHSFVYMHSCTPCIGADQSPSISINQSINHVTSESNVKTLSSPSRGMNNFNINHGISYQYQQLHGVLNYTVKLMDYRPSLSSWKKSSIYQCLADWVDQSQIVVSNSTTTISNSDDKNTTLCDCSWNVCHSTVSTHGNSPHDASSHKCRNHGTSAYVKIGFLYSLCTNDVAIWLPLYKNELKS